MGSVARRCVAGTDAPNLAAGNALGACVVNLAFLVVVDGLQSGQPMYRDASATHLLSAGFGVVMLGAVAMSLLMGARAPAVLHVGVYSPFFLALYLLALRSVQTLGLSRSFVGTVFMAVVTTLPEMAVTVSALRLGAAAGEGAACCQLGQRRADRGLRDQCGPGLFERHLTGASLRSVHPYG